MGTLPLETSRQNGTRGEQFQGQVPKLKKTVLPPQAAGNFFGAGEGQGRKAKAAAPADPQPASKRARKQPLVSFLSHHIADCWSCASFTPAQASLKLRKTACAGHVDASYLPRTALVQQMRVAACSWCMLKWLITDTQCCPCCRRLSSPPPLTSPAMRTGPQQPCPPQPPPLHTGAQRAHGPTSPLRPASR